MAFHKSFPEPGDAPASLGAGEFYPSTIPDAAFSPAQPRPMDLPVPTHHGWQLGDTVFIWVAVSGPRQTADPIVHISVTSPPQDFRAPETPITTTTSAPGDLIGYPPAPVLGNAWIASRTDLGAAGLLLEVRLAIQASGHFWHMRIENADSVSHQFTWVIADNSTNARQPWVDVRPSGIVSPAVVNLNLPNGDEGGVAQTQSFDVHNYGSGNLVVADVPGSQFGGSPFTVSAVTPTSPVGPLASATIEVSLSTNDAGLFTAIHRLRTNDANSKASPGHNDLVDLSGTVDPSLAPAFNPPEGEFSPRIGQPGDPITLYGANFDVLAVSVTIGGMTDSTPTVNANGSVTTAIPAVSSGDYAITVNTGEGSAVSTEQLIVV